MAVSNYRALQAFEAAVDLSDGYGKGVVVSNVSDHAATLPTGAGPILGVIIEAAPLGGTVGVCTERGTKVPVRVSAAVAKGAKLVVGADGRFATGTSDTVGVALEAATAANQIITMMFGV